MSTGRVRAKVLTEISPGLMPPEAARMLGRALLAAAAKAEEYAKANSVILDSAILLRSGAPFGITSNPRILDEARKEAQSNRMLRRYMPGGIKSKEQFGSPTVTNVPGTSPAEKTA